MFWGLYQHLLDVSCHLSSQESQKLMKTNVNPFSKPPLQIQSGDECFSDDLQVSLEGLSAAQSLILTSPRPADVQITGSYPLITHFKLRFHTQRTVAVRNYIMN